MKRIYIAAQAQEQGRLYAYTIPITESNNILSVLSHHKNLIAANVCDTKRRAVELVTAWNNAAKQNGRFMFDETF